MAEKRSIWDLIGNWPTKYVYISYIIVGIITLHTLTIPPPAIIPNVQITYDYVENIEPGSIVVLQLENSFAYFTGHVPASVSVLRHLLTKNVKLIVWSTREDGPLIWQYHLMPGIRDVLDAYNYEYGEDWVNLGFSTGMETAVAAFAANTWFMGRDYLGNNVEDIPLMHTVRSAEDVDLWLQAGTRALWPIRQLYEKYGTPIIMLELEGFIGQGPVYVQAGQLVSFTHGWPGGAMYEQLLERPSLGMSGGSTISVLYYTLFVLIILGNISWIGKKMAGGD